MVNRKLNWITNNYNPSYESINNQVLTILYTYDKEKDNFKITNSLIYNLPKGLTQYEYDIELDDINIIDVRATEDFAQGHIPGAINVPKERWNTPVGLRTDTTNIIYCYSEVCHLAAAAAKEFAEQGFPVMELEGGFEEWKHYDMPIQL